MGIWGRWRARHPKKYAGAEWATRDWLVVGAALALFTLGGVERAFVWVSLGLTAAFAGLWAVRYVRRRRLERVTDATAVFWADQIS